MIDNKPKYLKADFDALGHLVMEMYAPKQPQEVIEEAYKPDDFVTYQGSDHYVVEIDGNMAYIQDVNNDGGPFEVSISELEGEQAEGANPEQAESIKALFDMASDYGSAKSQTTKITLERELQDGIDKLLRNSNESDHQFIGQTVQEIRNMMQYGTNSGMQNSEDEEAEFEARMLGEF
jgi:hypothetical protein